MTTQVNGSADHWYLGTFMHRPHMGVLEVLENTLVQVNDQGVEAHNWKDLPGCVVHNTQPCNIQSVWVQGYCVHSREG